MIHHERNVGLREMVHAFTLWDEAADELMVSLGRALLERGIRIAVEHAGTQDSVSVGFDLRRIGKFAAVICEKDFEESHEEISSEQIIKRVEYSYD